MARTDVVVSVPYTRKEWEYGPYRQLLARGMIYPRNQGDFITGRSVGRTYSDQLGNARALRERRAEFDNYVGIGVPYTIDPDPSFQNLKYRQLRFRHGGEYRPFEPCNWPAVLYFWVETWGQDVCRFNVGGGSERYLFGFKCTGKVHPHIDLSLRWVAPGVPPPGLAVPPAVCGGAALETAYYDWSGGPFNPISEQITGGDPFQIPAWVTIHLWGQRVRARESGLVGCDMEIGTVWTAGVTMRADPAYDFTRCQDDPLQQFSLYHFCIPGTEGCEGACLAGNHAWEGVCGGKHTLYPYWSCDAGQRVCFPECMAMDPGCNMTSCLSDAGIVTRYLYLMRRP